MQVTRELFDEVMVPNYAPSSIIPVKGLGARIWDQSGNEYIDFAGGIAVNCLGHCNSELVETLNRQGNNIWHLSNTMTNEPALRLATKLTKATFADKVYFANSGAEANEAALKLARKWAIENFGEQKSQIISFNKSFHGRTFFTVTVGGQPSYSNGFGPKPSNVSHANYNDLESLKAIISNDTCAVILEPVLGEGGVIPGTPEFIRGVRTLCDKHNALLIFDEVQTGVGRTGNFYAYQGLNVTPDILTTAKALGGGFPIGAMLTTDSIAKHLKVGSHGSTYGGNPLACAVAETVVDIVSRPQILEGVKVREKMFHDELNYLNRKYNLFSVIRGKGLLIGAELNEFHKGRARELLTLSVENGLMCLVAGADVVRFAPSLIISNAEVREGFNRLEKAITQFINV